MNVKTVLPLGLAVGVILALAGCSSDHTVTDHINAELRSGAGEIDVGSAAEKDWDNMFVFGPYTPKKYVCNSARLSKWQCSTSGFDDWVDEGEFLLVFMRDESVSSSERFPRNADFDIVCLNRRIPRAKAHFTVERKARIKLMCR